MSCHRPFCRITSLAAFAVAAFVLLTPAQILPVRAQTAQAGQQSTLTGNAKSDAAKPDTARPPASRATVVGNVAAVDQANPAQQKSHPTKAIEKLRKVAKSA